MHTHSTAGVIIAKGGVVITKGVIVIARGGVVIVVARVVVVAARGVVVAARGGVVVVAARGVVVITASYSTTWRKGRSLARKLTLESQFFTIANGVLYRIRPDKTLVLYVAQNERQGLF